MKNSRNITDAIMEEGKSYRKIIPEIVVHIPGTNCPRTVDAKYRPYGENLIATGDIFLLSFYAQYLRGNQEELPGLHLLSQVQGLRVSG